MKHVVTSICSLFLDRSAPNRTDAVSAVVESCKRSMLKTCRSEGVCLQRKNPGLDVEGVLVYVRTCKFYGRDSILRGLCSPVVVALQLHECGEVQIYYVASFRTFLANRSGLAARRGEETCLIRVPHKMFTRVFDEI